MLLVPVRTMAMVLLLWAATGLPAAAQVYQESLPRDHPAISYPRATGTDPASRLMQRVEQGEVTLDYRDGGLGYLPSLLEQLDIAADSQIILVFSKTSFQEDRISPRTPRAVYFADDAMVGFVLGGDLIELVGLDPREGPRFYTIEAALGARPVFDRPAVCMRCHHGAATAGVPGLYISSVHTRPSGRPDFGLGSIVTDHRTPFEDRWGGWYVTGTHGDQQHRGNTVLAGPAVPGALSIADSQNLTALTRQFDTSPYLGSTSDLVALMTLEHQTQMVNLLTRVGWEARIAEHDGIGDERLNATVEDLLAYMLFADEAPLTATIAGVSTFSRSFPARGPRDRHGRSLRDFDLETRLFRYPLSYMVHSPSFEGMPRAAHARVVQRLREILSGDDRTARYANLHDDDRRAIVEILRDTLPNLLPPRD